MAMETDDGEDHDTRQSVAIALGLNDCRRTKGYELDSQDSQRAGL